MLPIRPQAEDKQRLVGRFGGGGARARGEAGRRRGGFRPRTGPGGPTGSCSMADRCAGPIRQEHTYTDRSTPMSTEAHLYRQKHMHADRRVDPDRSTHPEGSFPQHPGEATLADPGQRGQPRATLFVVCGTCDALCRVRHTPRRATQKKGVYLHPLPPRIFTPSHFLHRHHPYCLSSPLSHS
jgi:hypothetical protein